MNEIIFFSESAFGRQLHSKAMGENIFTETGISLEIEPRMIGRWDNVIF